MPPPLSFLDLMGGVGRGHRVLAALPGAQRVSPAMRQAQKNMIPGEIVEQANNAQMFGRTKSGEPIRATMAAPYGSNRDAVERGQMPSSGRIRLDPESKAPKDADAAGASGVYPYISWYEGLARPGKELLGSELARRMKLHEMTNPMATASMPRAEMLEFNAMDVKPDASVSPADAWWLDLPAKGKELYSLGYDALRAAGHGNVASMLTGVNDVRRLGNVASHSLGHGDTGFISPLQEHGYDYANPGRSSQLFSEPKVAHPDKERAYLMSLFGKDNYGGRSKDLVDPAYGLRTPDFIGMTPDEILGTILTREGQLSAVYGPAIPGHAILDFASPFRYKQARPHDDVLLKSIAEPGVLANPGRLSGAFGPATLGRQATTELLIRGMLLKGYEPEGIAKLIVEDAAPGSFRNRYAKGGLAHAAA